MSFADVPEGEGKMVFDLTDEQEMIQDMARNFAQKEVLPKAAELDETARFPEELVRQMAELGLMGVAVPEEYGGAGMDNICYAIAMEEISRACASTSVIMSVNNSLACDPILTYGSEEQKRKYLVPLASGRHLGCFGLTEPGAGSDAGSQKTIAVRDGSYYLVNGTKNFITNAPQADTCVLFTMTDKEKKHKGITAFILDMKTGGVTVGKNEKKMGISASATASIILEDAKIPAENRIGNEGDGFKIAMHTLDGGRIGIAAQAIGIARASLEDSLAYAKERRQFGQPSSMPPKRRCGRASRGSRSMEGTVTSGSIQPSGTSAMRKSRKSTKEPPKYSGS
jgi:butyryl-CoA dehydrogenase